MGSLEWRKAKGHALQNSEEAKQVRYETDLAQAGANLANFLGDNTRGGEAMGMLAACKRVVKIYADTSSKMHHRYGSLTGGGLWESYGRDEGSRIDVSTGNCKNVVSLWMQHPDPSLNLAKNRTPPEFMLWLVAELDRIAEEELKEPCM